MGKEFGWYSLFQIERLAFDTKDVIARVRKCNEQELKTLNDIKVAYKERYGKLHTTDMAYHGFFEGRPLSRDGKNLALVICDDGWLRVIDEDKAVYLPNPSHETHNQESSDSSHH